MLFLVIDRAKLEFVPSEVSIAQLKMFRQTLSMYKDFKENGKIKEIYSFADHPGIVTIWDVESHEELQKILFMLPSTPFMERDVKPLANVDSLDDIAKELIDIVKSMPSFK
ncbi:MAG: hypothetical protein KatS3mg003_1032 [Candidatus Nitrosocaldaceae archaeon]|nr:MAG: hypothetical protein KatS3mg003_1032 [Candidatus Nitrosocaldaceae archaeon]